MNISGPGGDAHRALTLGRQSADRATLHHARSDPNRDQDRFYYEEADRPRITQGHTGLSQVARLSSRERNVAETCLREYGQDDRNIPRISSGTNCHNFARRRARERRIRPPRLSCLLGGPAPKAPKRRGCGSREGWEAFRAHSARATH
jgi:hypothetical protein